MSTQLAVEQEMATILCCQCSILFAVPVTFQQARLADHQAFYCPSGHANHYPGKTELDRERQRSAKLAEQLQVEQNRHTWTKQNLAVAERQRNAQKGKVTMLKNRIKRGQCPCCKAKFADLAGHMADQHPGYAE